jgi:hypothetical protein
MQKTLTKKYRLIYKDGIIENDYKQEWTGTTYYDSEFKTGFESDNFQDIINKIAELNLIEK